MDVGSALRTTNTSTVPWYDTSARCPPSSLCYPLFRPVSTPCPVSSQPTLTSELTNDLSSQIADPSSPPPPNLLVGLLYTGANVTSQKAAKLAPIGCPCKTARGGGGFKRYQNPSNQIVAPSASLANHRRSIYDENQPRKRRPQKK